MTLTTDIKHQGSWVRVGAAQMNTTVGDIDGNVAIMRQWIQRARKQGVQVLVFPELSICGYPPKDLLLKTQFIEEQRQALETLVPETKGMFVVVGLVVRERDSYNAAAVMHDGKLLGIARKVGLPNYRVFDEKRYFQRGEFLSAFHTDIADVGVLICEDVWHPEIVSQIAASGVELIVCVSASPFSVGRSRERETMIQCRCQDHSVGFVFCNLVGGQDELIFDGNSLIAAPSGRMLSRGKSFEEDLVVADIQFEEIHRNRLAAPIQRDIAPGEPLSREAVRLTVSDGETQSFERTVKPPSDANPFLYAAGQKFNPVEDAYNALVLGVGDYVRKNGFKSVVIGLSGGIDSALTATIAVDALGADNVVGVSMPSRYSSGHSKSDAEDLAKNLGIEYKQFAIETLFQTYLELFEDEFKETKPDITEENLQARIRGALLMALSNKFGHLVLATGNKSELSVGYATLYGDMCGGLAVIGDVPKTLVFQMARYVNQSSGRIRIPENTIDKPPSAELREDQKDTDSLPPYGILDGILYAYIEQDCSVPEIIELGYDPDLVRRIVNLVDKAEHKRRQAAIVLRVTSKAFGSDRRLPVTNKYKSG
ncbi:MAG: NAD+ synthase [Candidatus Hinthialibacter antarcticus]|nr:NAD+ synthase [Candidatus Hinthialibacter antarcticus]